jgi:F-type H+-transporting ATPase subunit b
MIPDLSSLWVIVFLLLCVFTLNTLVFQPVLRVIEARERAVSDARDLATTATERAASAAAEYDSQLNAARTVVYREMDDKRRIALEQRTALLGETRGVVERELAAATAKVQAESQEARASLDREAESLAGAIVSRVLGRAS